VVGRRFEARSAGEQARNLVREELRCGAWSASSLDRKRRDGRSTLEREKKDARGPRRRGDESILEDRDFDGPSQLSPEWAKKVESGPAGHVRGVPDTFKTESYDAEWDTYVYTGYRLLRAESNRTPGE